MTAKFRTAWLLAWLGVGALRALGQSDVGTLASLLASAEEKSPDVILVLVDGRENEMFTRKITYEPGMDIYDIHLAHLSDKYFIWQVNFGDSPMIEDGVFTLCLDTDRNDDTGIKTVDDLAGKVVGVQSACSAEKAVDKLTGLLRELNLDFALTLNQH